MEEQTFFLDDPSLDFTNVSMQDGFETTFISSPPEMDIFGDVFPPSPDAKFSLSSAVTALPQPEPFSLSLSEFSSVKEYTKEPKLLPNIPAPQPSVRPPSDRTTCRTPRIEEETNLPPSITVKTLDVIPPQRAFSTPPRRGFKGRKTPNRVITASPFERPLSSCASLTDINNMIKARAPLMSSPSPMKRPASTQAIIQPRSTSSPVHFGGSLDMLSGIKKPAVSRPTNTIIPTQHQLHSISDGPISPSFNMKSAFLSPNNKYNEESNFGFPIVDTGSLDDHLQDHLGESMELSSSSLLEFEDPKADCEVFQLTNAINPSPPCVKRAKSMTSLPRMSPVNLESINESVPPPYETLLMSGGLPAPPFALKSIDDSESIPSIFSPMASPHSPENAITPNSATHLVLPPPGASSPPPNFPSGAYQSMIRQPSPRTPSRRKSRPNYANYA